MSRIAYGVNAVAVFGKQGKAGTMTIIRSVPSTVYCKWIYEIYGESEYETEA